MFARCINYIMTNYIKYNFTDTTSKYTSSDNENKQKNVQKKIYFDKENILDEKILNNIKNNSLPDKLFPVSLKTNLGKRIGNEEQYNSYLDTQDNEPKSISINDRYKKKRKIFDENNDDIYKKNDTQITTKTNENAYEEDFIDSSYDIILDRSNSLKNLHSHFANIYQDNSLKSYIPEIHESFTSSRYSKLELSGDKILANIRRVLDEFGLVRTDVQKRFHEGMLNACLPKIYGDNISSEKERLLKETGKKRISQELLIITGRRMGKTTASAMFIAALLIAGPPGCKIVVFSVAMRSSRKMISMIDKFIKQHPTGRSKLINPHTQERITCSGDSEHVIKTCLSLPGTKGVSILFFFKKKVNFVYVCVCIREIKIT